MTDSRKGRPLSCVAANTRKIITYNSINCLCNSRSGHARLPLYHCTSTLVWQTSPTHKFTRDGTLPVYLRFSSAGDPLKQPLLAGPGLVCQPPGFAAQGGVETYPSHPSTADHSRHSIPQDEAEPLLPKSNPSTGPAYDSFFSHAQDATCNAASSSMQPGMGIPQPDGSVLPITVTHDMTPLPSNQFNVHEGFPPQQGTTVAGPGPQTTGTHSQQYDSYLPSLTATTPASVPEAGYVSPIPPKGGATAGPAPEFSSYQTHIPLKEGAIAGPAPEKRSMARHSSSAVPGPAPQYTSPCGPHDPIMSIQPQPASPQPMSPQPMSPQPMFPQPMFPQPQPTIPYPPPQPMPPQPVFPQPPTVQYLHNQQPRPLPTFPPSQYQPYQPVQPPQSSNATVPTTPYIPYRDQTQHVSSEI